jgi:hypothetical protein
MRGTRLLRALAACGVLATVATAGGVRALPVVGLTAVPVATFATPTFLTSAPGDPTAVYVTERTGTVKRVVGSHVTATSFLDITSRVSITGESGLLSVAFPPDYASSGLFYVYYGNTAGNVEIDEFTRSAADPTVADPASRRTVLVVAHPVYTNHYGGQLQFGPDGYLYAGLGDGGGGGDPSGNGQNLGVLLAKILRIDPRQSGGDAYTVPADNPFVSTPGARPEIWAYGVRNPFRFSFDRATGDLTIGDVGQDTREEVDLAPAGTGAGANYGWNIFEGTFQFRPGTLTNHTPPVLERPRNMGFCTSIVGGYVVRDPGLPSLAGDYVYGDYCTGSLRAAHLELPFATNDRGVNAAVPNLSSFGEDAAGCLYVISLSGPVFRLVESEASLTAPCAIPAA